MKTIDERAREASYANLDRLSPAFEEGYIKGATEQQAIDNEQLCEMVLDNQEALIDKACEAFKATCKEQGAGSCDREWLCDGCNKYEHFRKATKGE